jgi:hypothetical protein
MFKSIAKCLKNVPTRFIAVRSMTHYPIDDVMFGLTDDQIAVNLNNLNFIFYLNASYHFSSGNQFLILLRRNWHLLHRKLTKIMDTIS